MKTAPPDRSIIVKELEERLLKKWRKEKTEKKGENARDPKRQITSPSKKNQ